MDIKGKRAIVTGSTKGIGRAIAEALLDRGASVAITSRTKSDVDQTVGQLSAGGHQVFGRACDVSKREDMESLIAATGELWGGIDILINNAGIGVFKPVEQMKAEEWRSTIATNLDALFYACHAVIPWMKKAGEGFIVNIGSLAGKNAFSGGAAYNASKFGLIGFSEALMQEVRYDGILVAYIMPGSVDTAFGSGMGNQGEASWEIAASDVAEVLMQTLERHPRCLTSRIEMRPSKPPRK